MKPTIYIAGPMTGYHDFNRPAFHAAAQALRRAGYRVECPAENQEPNADATWSDWMRVALRQMLTCHAVALLPGWEDSAGARMEQGIAMRLEMATWPLAKWLAISVGNELVLPGASAP